MRRRLDLAMTLVGDPCVIFLDEPSAGLDPRSRRDLWQIIRNLVAGGVTVFLTTQYLEEADQLADRIALLDQGHIVAEGTAKELKRLAPGGSIRLQFPDPPALARAATVLGDGERNDDALTLQVPSDGGVRSLRALLDRLDAEAIEVTELAVQTPELDDVFLALTDRPTRTKGASREQPRICSHRLGNHAATQPAPCAALPLDDDLDRLPCPWCSCSCSTTCSAGRLALGFAASPKTTATTSTSSPRASS